MTDDDWMSQALGRSAVQDQQVAEMQGAGRAWGAFYAALRAAGVPPRMAAVMTHRQQAYVLRVALHKQLGPELDA